MSDAEMLAVLNVKIDKLQKNMALAKQSVDKQLTKIEKRSAKMSQRLGYISSRAGRQFGNNLARSLKGSMGAALAALSVAQVQKFADTWVEAGNKIRGAGIQGDAILSYQKQLARVAIETRSEYESTVALFSRLSLIAKDAGVSQGDVLKATKAINQAFVAGGASAMEAASAARQLAQAIGSGRLQGDELRSVLENAPLIARAIAEEFGVAVGELKTLGSEGKLVSDRVLQAIIKKSGEFGKVLGDSQKTTAQGFENLKTGLIVLSGALVDFTGTAGVAAGILNSVGEAAYAAADGVRDFKGEISSIQVQKKMKLALGPSVLEKRGLDFFLGGESPSERRFKINKTNKDARENEAYSALLKNMGPKLKFTSSEEQIALINSVGRDIEDRLTEMATLAANQNTDLMNRTQAGLDNQITKTPDKKKGGSGSGRRSRTSRASENDYERSASSMRERMVLIEAETAALATLNPLIDDYGYSVDRAKAAIELENSAKQAGIAITPQLKEQIDQLASGYAEAQAKAAELAERNDDLRARAEEMRSLGKDVMGGFIQDLRDGKSASDALAGALDKVANKLIDIALNSAFDGKGNFLSNLFSGGGGGSPISLSGIGGGIGGVVKALISHRGGVVGGAPSMAPRALPAALFQGAPRYHSGGIAGDSPLRPGEIPTILERGELVLPKNLTSKLGGGQGRSPAITFSPITNIDARGADAAAVARIERGQKELQKNFGRQVMQISHSAELRNTRA